MSAEVSDKAYKLRCTLLGHTADVRAVASTTTGDILTASRDKTARLWKSEQDRSFTSVTEYSGQTGYVTSVCYLPPDDSWPEGLVFTGSRDSTIMVYKPSQAIPIKQLSGHTDTVSCLACHGTVLVSGSWDHTARVWSTNDTGSPTFLCKAQLKAHTGPLWAVALLPGDQGILTAAADKNIFLWQQHQVSRKYLGHTDCVRGLAVVDGTSFLSCSNDASIRRWDVLSGQCTSIYYGHTNFVYSLSALLSPTGIFIGFVSGSEDRTAKVWSSNGICLQTLNQPCQSTWSVAALPNTDIVVGTSDGACRVYTTSEARAASALEQQALSEQVAAAARPATELGDIQRDKLPDRTALLRPGTKDGQTLMVREDGKVMCYSWCMSKTQWEAVGEVVGGTGASNTSSGKVLYQGKEYDYVFSVELDEGGALKLPYNNSDDPYVVAQQFVHLHELPQDHLDQVAKFIIANSAPREPAGATGSGYYDPFTGGNRYTPGESGGASGSSSTGGGVDPFTSSGGYSPATSVQSSHYPQTTSLLFEACNVQGISTKFHDNNKLVDEKVRLSTSQVDLLLSSVFLDGEATNIKAENLGSLEVALQWGPELVWPALDVLRVCLRSKAVQDLWVAGSKGASIVNLLTSLLKPPATVPTQLLAIRCLVNLAAHPAGCDRLTNSADSLLSTVTDMAPYPNKNMEIAAATLLLNCAVLLTRKTSELSDLCQVLSGLCTLLVSCKDSEALYRALVGIGTVLVKGSPECRQFAKSLDLQPLLDALLSHPVVKVKECAAQVMIQT